VTSVEEHFPADFASLCLCDEEKEALVVASSGSKSEELAKELMLREHGRIQVQQDGLARCIQGELVFESDISKLDCSFTNNWPRKESARWCWRRCFSRAKYSGF